MKKREEARKVLGKAVGHINLLLPNEQDNSRLYSLQGAFYGFSLFLKPFMALKYKNLSREANQRAIQLDPSEPQAWMEKANMEFYTPIIFGGSRKRAVPLFEKAVWLYESYPECTCQNWVYLNCLVGLALAYEKTGKIEDAEIVYKKLLNLESSFIWVRDDLYPGFQKNHSMN